MPEYPTTDEGKVPLVGEREEVMGAVVSAFSDMPTLQWMALVRYDDGGTYAGQATQSRYFNEAEGRNQEALDHISLMWKEDRRYSRSEKLK